MELPVLLRRSARYVLVQRGFIVLTFIVAASAIALFTHVFSRFLRADTNIGMAMSAVFGIVLVWTSAPLVKRGTMRIDRAFFRSAYDSRIILHDLAEKTRTVSDRRQLATLIERHVSESAAPGDPGVLPGIRQRPAGRNLRNVPGGPRNALGQRAGFPRTRAPR
jgi:hypothetical protein